MTKHWTWQSFGSAPIGANMEVVARAAADGARVRLDGALSIAPGDHVAALGVRLQGTGAAQTCELYVVRDGADGRTPIAKLDIIDPPATWETYTFELGEPCAVRAGETIKIVACLPLAGTCVGAIGHAKLAASEGVAA